MNEAKSRAIEVLHLIEQDYARYHGLPDIAGQKIHCLFLGLYRDTTFQWLRALEQRDDPLFAYLVVRHFYEQYKSSVPDHLMELNTRAARPWTKYHWLAKRLTLRSPISMHLVLLTFGVRAHVRHDLSSAISRAIVDFQHETGQEVDLADKKPDIIGPISTQAFYCAALDYVEGHRRDHRGWRRGVLNAYATGLKLLRVVWVPVMERWRHKAWENVIAARRS
jgi:hypothetical protein